MKTKIIKYLTFALFLTFFFSCSSVNDEVLPTNNKATPLSPSNLIGVVSTTGISLSWNDNSNDENGFTIERKTGVNSGNFEVIGTVNSNQTQYVDSNLNLSNILQYRVRAFNSIGTSAGYSNLFTYEPSSSSITIGSQVWGLKNLDVVTYRDGTPIPQVSDPNQWANLTTGAWCYYNNDSSNNGTGGKLYNWYAVAGIFDEASKTDITKRKQLAPVGTIPTNDEWWELRFALSSSNQNFRFINTVGFRNIDGTFEGTGSKGFFWTSTQITDEVSWSRNSLNGINNLLQDGVYKKMGLSVRFLEQKNTSTSTYGLPEWTLIPDDKFEKSLILQGIDDVFDGKVLTSKVSNLKLFRMEHTHVKDITGIESFVSVESLFLWDNDFTTINITKMEGLKILNLSECPVSTIDLSKNTELIEIGFNHSTSGANDPTYPFGKTAGLTSLDLSKNIKIQRIYLMMNRLSSIDVSMLTQLTDLWIGNTDLGKNDSNTIQSLDLRNNPKLVMAIFMNMPHLNYLNVKGSNPRRVMTKGCPNLKSITVSSVQVANQEYASGLWEKDPGCVIVE